MPDVTELRHRFFRELGAYEARGSTSGQRHATGGSTGSLIEARWPLRTPRFPRTNAYDGWTLLRPGASPDDAARLVVPGGLDSVTGALTPDADWTTAPIAGEAYELLGPGIDPADELLDYLNQALKLIWLIDDVHFTPATDDTRGPYVPALDAAGNDLASWLVNQDQVISVRAQASIQSYCDATLSATGPYRGDAWRAGDRLYLRLAEGRRFPGGTVWATVKKPAYYHCRVLPTDEFGSVAGLEAEGNECLPLAEWVVAGAIAAAWDHAPQVLEQAVEQRRRSNLLHAAELFREYQGEYWMLNRQRRTFYPVVPRE